jgi:hypothetical protein
VRHRHPRALAAQEERRAAERAERVAAARARRGLKPLPDPAAERFVTEDEVPLLGRSFDGRLGRMSYLAGNLMAWAGMALSCSCWSSGPAGRPAP